MKQSYLERHDDALKAILTALPGRIQGQEKTFVEQFYAKMPAADLEKLDPSRAVAAALSACAFFQERPKGAPTLRVFTPAQEIHNWQSHHLVIELLNDDMPFLVDSLTAELMRLGFNVYETIHPIYYVERDAKGALKELLLPNKGKGHKESFIHFEVSCLPEELSEMQLIDSLNNVLEQVRAAFGDWKAILGKVHEASAQLEPAPSGIDPEEVKETKDFLTWLANNHFVFLGYVEYDFFDNGKEALKVVEGSRLGVLKVDDSTPRGLEALPPESRHFLLVPQLVEITKSNRKSRVHRPVHMDYIGIKRFDKSGKVIGERRFLGLFTSTVYYQSAEYIPIIRRKIAQVMERAGFEAVSHDGKALKTILEFLPRDEVFQIGIDDLFNVSMGILSLEARPAVRVFVRKDAFERFISCMVFVPREYFSTRVRFLIQDVLEKAYQATVSVFYTQIGESPLARLHLILKTTPGAIPPVDPAVVEAEVAKICYQWIDLLRSEMIGRYGEHKTTSLIRAYGAAFPEGYVSRYSISQAIFDIEKIIQTQATAALSLEFYRHESELHLKIYSPTEEIALSDILPMLENSGLRVIDEHPFLIQPHDGSCPVWIRDFRLVAQLADNIAFESLKEKFENSLASIWQHETENDRFNALVLRANLSARQIEMLRAYAHYLKQVAYAYGQPVIEQALLAHPQLANLLVKLFETRFDPANESNREQNEQHLVQQIEAGLADVTSVAEDRIIRRYMEIIRATLRTNYFQRDGEQKMRPILSFKFDSARVPELPLPRPYAEIFVYSIRMEGIHLRGGKVARGGLRWSDRFEDFRTEVLGLMKAQMVKNSVIVPVGSKGGFVVKRPPEEGGRDALQAEGIACYKLYLQGLLDLTDNIIEGRITPPRGVVCHDGEDPYLVVAADKGTATFSDIANEVSRSYGFWLDDAFASGGSAGYDHKKMGITARGAWVSVVRHFAEMGVDIARDDFTVVGIGDMSGDVFGNGMLLSENIQLLAAFNHLHIFIDPTPDTKKSFAERKRMFELPRSTWKDYDTSLISKGGGVFERSAKTITVSPEAKKALDLDKDTYTPDELIRALLTAPVDLLWNGGIGTYVKAADETHEHVGDRANNAVRVNGNQLRCKVVGEGGNLGFTQKGRIEYAFAGGRINTDAIDNSAGVDCSDHEVNIKIAFSRALQSNELTRQKRDTILAGMTEEVAALVLKDNILQTQAITIAHQQGASLLESQQQLMHMLEHQHLLDREIEFLPTDKLLTELRLAGRGLTRPSLAVLLAYSKLSLYRALVESDLPDDEYFSSDLIRYFPKTMHDSFDECIEGHPLRREIIATVVTNSLINRVGMTFYSDIAMDTNLPARDIASAYTLARDAFSLRKIWSMIEAEGAKIAPHIQAELYAGLTRFVESMTMWFLRNQPLPLSMGKIMAEFMPGIEEFCENQEAMFSRAAEKAYAKQYEYWTGAGVPEPIAKLLSSLEMRLSACDVIAIANKAELPIATVGKIYFELGSRLHLGWLRRSAQRVPTDSHWERVAVQSIVQDLYEQQRRLCTLVIEMYCQDRSCPDVVEEWYQKYRIEVDRYEEFVGDLKASEAPDFSILVVALRNLKSLCAL